MHKRHSRAPGNNEMHGVTPVLLNGAMGKGRPVSDDGYNGCRVTTNDCTVETVAPCGIGGGVE